MRRSVAVALLAILASAAVGAEAPLQDAARELVGVDQGVYAVAEDGTVLASLNADRAVHPASVTKVAATLALLERLGPAHRFETRLLATGPVRDGVLRGDLVVEAGGDPALVFEDAFRLLAELRTLGVRRVEGTLRVRGPLLFNWEPDPAGRRLRRALEGRDGKDAWARAVAAWPELAARPLPGLALVFGDARRGPGRAAPRPLVVHRSAPLLQLTKVLNGYSNNVFHLVSDRIGGPTEVERIARAHVPAEMAVEVIIQNAAGAGTTNRMSPRAAVALVEALRREVERHGRALVDVLPVTGIDPGTLRDRLTDGLVVGKTGTYGSLGACALAGALRTRRHGRVTFAVLDRGLSVPEARRRQDAFVRALAEASEAIAWDYVGGAPPVYAAAEVRAASAGDAAP